MTVAARLFVVLTGLLAAGGAAAEEMTPDGAPADWPEPVMDQQIYYFLKTDRLEAQTNEGDGLFVWDAEGWVGGDYNKLWIKSEGEYLFEHNRLEAAEVQALYSRAITPFFDVQAGVRHDFKPDPSRTFGVLGIEGLAPYWFEIDAAGFVSDDGDVSARLEAEYDFLFTQRLILQPRVELNFAVQDVKKLGIGSGLSTAELGLRLRYEFVRQVAPYIGVSWTRLVGQDRGLRARRGRAGEQRLLRRRRPAVVLGRRRCPCSFGSSRLWHFYGEAAKTAGEGLSGFPDGAARRL